MNILGIVDTHEAGAAVICDGRITSAVTEERLNRIKSWAGFPELSIKCALKESGLSGKDIDLVVMAGIHTPLLPNRAYKMLNYRSEKGKKKGYESPDGLLMRPYLTLQSALRKMPGIAAGLPVARYLLKRKLNRLFGIDCDIQFADHHLLHAYAATLSGFDEALSVTVDGQGDGASTCVYEYRNGRITLLNYCNALNSIGEFYRIITYLLGFNPQTGAGKVTGLAAYGQPVMCKMFNRYLYFDADSGSIRNQIGTLFGGLTFRRLKRMVKDAPPEDVAASAQELLEKVMVAYVDHWVGRTGIRNIVLNGGVALNIKMNRHILELPSVEDVFAFPPAGDGGLALLAAVYGWMERSGTLPADTNIKHVYFGPEYSNTEVAAALERAGVEAQFHDDIDGVVADLIAEGQCVWRFQGRMEFGPRALGHRSILALPSLPDLKSKLNQSLGRESFMPFCPSILDDASSRYLKDDYFAPFMILCCNVKDDYADDDSIAHIVHVDKTVRPQIVYQQIEPRYWSILKRVHDATGTGCLLNTSFNVHGEPIVMTPEDALVSFREAGGRYLAIENYLVENKDSKLL